MLREAKDAFGSDNVWSSMTKVLAKVNGRTCHIKSLYDIDNLVNYYRDFVPHTGNHEVYHDQSQTTAANTNDSILSAETNAKDPPPSTKDVNDGHKLVSMDTNNEPQTNPHKSETPRKVLPQKGRRPVSSSSRYSRGGKIPTHRAKRTDLRYNP